MTSPGADLRRIIAVTDDGPPAGTTAGSEWEGGWDSAMEAVRDALSSQAVEQKTVTCYCTCPDCSHGCCHIPIYDLTDDELDEVYRRRDLAEAAMGCVRALHARVLRMEALVCAHCDHAWPCATIRAIGDPAATQATEPVSSPVRNLIAAVIRDFPFDDYGMDNVSYALEADPDTQEWVPALATAVLDAVLPPFRITAGLARDSEATVQRAIDLYEQWCKAGAPPLGTSMSRWWDARLIELRNAILPPTDAAKEQ